MFTVPEVARFLGITPQAVRQRIVEGRLQASKVRVKGIAREYRISGEAIQEHYDCQGRADNRPPGCRSSAILSA